MKNLIPSLAFAAALALTTTASADWQSDFSELLSQYAKPSGVDYEGWAKNADDLAKLESVVEAIASDKPSGSSDEELAFYINAYNAWILHLFLQDHPKSNTNAIKRNAFFGRDLITVAGEKMSFNRLEHEIIRPTFDEPRVHFALNCASVSCPPLLEEAYSSHKLDAQLTAQTKAFVNDNPLGVKVEGKTAKVSELFRWFSEDFANGDIKGFINQYRDEPLGDNIKIAYQNYDWNRNEAK